MLCSPLSLSFHVFCLSLFALLPPLLFFSPPAGVEGKTGEVKRQWWKEIGAVE